MWTELLWWFLTVHIGQNNLNILWISIYNFKTIKTEMYWDLFLMGRVELFKISSSFHWQIWIKGRMRQDSKFLFFIYTNVNVEKSCSQKQVDETGKRISNSFQVVCPISCDINVNAEETCSQKQVTGKRILNSFQVICPKSCDLLLKPF